ncbi:MAG: serine/threonine-protein kinase [Chromatiales bacterium]|jgi:serine/threonine-protein kinase
MPTQLPKKLGKYEVRSILGQGAMGVVYQGFDPDIERTVAIKILHPHLIDTTEGDSFRQRFRREAQAAAKCFHPNIVAVFDLGQDSGRDFIVMEYIQGEELKYFLDSGNQFSRNEAALIVTEVLKALASAHAQGVVHRDIKPANIILLDDGSVKVADFGVARLDQSELTLAGNMVGTPSYMCPEGLRGEQVDSRADIYSTGMVLFELLTRRKPHPQELYSQSIEQFIDKVFAEHEGEIIPIELQQLLRQALASDAGKRFASANDFASAINRLIADPDNGGQSAIEQLSETVVSQRPLIKPETPTHFEWSQDVLKELEHGLASYVGPLASVLVRRSSTANTTPEALVSSLAEHIADPQEKQQFLSKAKRCIRADSTHDTATTTAAHSTLADTMTAEQLEELSRKFAFFVGPLARRVVNKYASQYTDMHQLCQQLADQIADEKEREAFLRSVC